MKTNKNTEIMSTENNNQESKSNELYTVLDTGSSVTTMILPLQMEWKPKEDITTYELAMCLPYFFRIHGVMPYEVDMELTHFRHFKITDPNKQLVSNCKYMKRKTNGMENKYVIIDLRNMDYMKDENGKINYYETEEEACLVCGMYEFENAWVMKLIFNHIEQ